MAYLIETVCCSSEQRDQDKSLFPIIGIGIRNKFIGLIGFGFMA